MTNRFEIQKSLIKDLHILQRKPLGDSRGYLERMFCQEELESILKGKIISQVNHTLTDMTGTVRGLHYQFPPFAETKLISCIHGEVFDVAVDLRKGSSTFLQYHAEILSANNYKTMVIPEGFAHGFQTLSQNCEMLYFHTTAYNSDSEGALNVTDPGLNIKWPLEITDISNRDLNHPLITDEFMGISL